MQATLLPLQGKYYGTEIELHLNDGKNKISYNVLPLAVSGGLQALTFV